jgi:hypothetical protein
VDDTASVPGDELAAVARALAELGERPLPPAVATRLDTRLAAELTASPLAARRSRRRLQLGASLSAAAAVAALAVFALSSGGGGTPPAQQGADALRTSVASATADSAATTAADAPEGAFSQTGPAAKKCAPASRTGGDRPSAACPGARGGHARAV